MLLSEVNGGCSQRPEGPGKIWKEHQQIKFREVKAVKIQGWCQDRQQDWSYKYTHLCKKNIEGMGMIENNQGSLYSNSTQPELIKTEAVITQRHRVQQV